MQRFYVIVRCNVTENELEKSNVAGFNSRKKMVEVSDGK